MLRAVIVDDERPAIHRLQQILNVREDVEIVGGFTKASEALKAFPELRPDVAFLDIEMPERNGLELAALLLDMQEDLEIIFTTAYSQYALEAFRVNAIDYLLKPVDPGLLERTIQRIYKRKERGSSLNRAAENAYARIQCFGSFAVFGRNGETVRFPTMKTEELLAYFLTRRDTDLSKWAICEALWPEQEPEKSEQNLHTSVYRMKKTLQENGVRIHLESRKGVYRFEVLDSCDYRQLVELSSQSLTPSDQSLDDAERMLLQYRGTLFGDKDYAWCEWERERVQKIFAGLAKQLIRIWMDAKNVDRAHELLQFLLERVPYDETAHEWLLSIYVLRKDRIAFFTHYKKMEDWLLKEVGIAPSASVRRLYKKIKTEMK